MKWCILLALLSSGLPVAQAGAKQTPAEEIPAEQADQDDAEQLGLLMRARDLLEGNKIDEAILLMDRVLAFYDAEYADDKRLHYAGRSQAEVLAYMLHAANQGKSAVALKSTNWVEAHYMKGYALLESKRLDEAKVSLEGAVEMSPYNSQYVSELAYLYGQEGDWKRSHELFEAALDHAAFTPEASQLGDKSRACRGSGYALVELARMEDAEKKYLQCLALDPRDASSQRELEWVRRQLAKGIAE